MDGIACLKGVSEMERISQKSGRKGELALITGSRRGIGLGIALALSEAGFNIVLNGVSQPEAAEEAVEKIRKKGCLCEYIQADISQKADRERLVSQVKEDFGRLDILVNNAGVVPQPREDILIAPEQSFDLAINVNLKGPYFLTRDIANWMIDQKKGDPRRNQKIINISSINAFTASPSRAEYCMSKAGLSMMTALFAIRLAEFGIGVYEIRPGIIKTDMTKPVKEKYDRLISDGVIPIKRWGTPEDMGKAVFAIATDCFPFSTGEVIHIDGGFRLRTL
jgi:NAD(P)-dependent dehydrogenase (short-subunit alcohol dehydrogenase family)